MISIIIPVYNKERFLEKCINSILNQTYSNIEIILIDDGSSDMSRKIISKYVIKYPEIVRGIKGGHKGVSNARNEGLKIAKGEYILFVDADDYLEPDYVYRLVEYSKYDLVVSGLLEQKYMSEHVVHSTRTFDLEIDTKSQDIENIYTKRIFPIFSVVYTKLFKKSIINKYHLNFKYQQYGEDTLFVLEYIKHIKNIKMIPYAGYVNLIVDNTLSRTHVTNIWNYLKVIPDEVDEHGKSWQFLFVRSIKLTLLNDAINFRSFRQQCNIITNDYRFYYASISLLKSFSDKTILSFLKLKIYWLLFIIFKWQIAINNLNKFNDAD